MLPNFHSLGEFLQVFVTCILKTLMKCAQLLITSLSTSQGNNVWMQSRRWGPQRIILWYGLILLCDED